jgi:hypothetical protein
VNGEGGDNDLLGEKYCWGEVMPQPQRRRNGIIPLKVLGVDIEQFLPCHRASWCIKYVQRFVDNFGKLAECLVHATNI